MLISNFDQIVTSLLPNVEVHKEGAETFKQNTANPNNDVLVFRCHSFEEFMTAISFIRKELEDDVK